MRHLASAIVLALGVSAGAAGGYWYARLPAGVPASDIAPENMAAAAPERRILYYRDPTGAPYWSAEPKKDADGRDYLPVYEDEEISFEPRAKTPPATAGGPRKILYYRNPMGLPDTSPVPKKDWMGMDYIPVYEGEEQDDGKTVKVSLDKVQRSGVRTEAVEARVVVRPVRAVGTVTHDESRLTVELYRIADHSHLWVIADVAEADLPAIKMGTRATVMVRAYAAQAIEGEVTFIYPELRAETRTARVRIEIPNPDGRLKVDMYADVVFQTGEAEPVAAVPASAVIDSGTRQVVLVAKGEGRFEPRPVKLGVRGDGYVKVLEGVSKGEEVVTSATFLIDAESNLKAALQAFTQPEAPK
jgi:Cu(I)/Ag(I) efflux system membrane fusion protein